MLEPHKPNRSETIVAIEYEQLGCNLRETWRYISEITKMWIIFEASSIILVLICFHYHHENQSAANVVTKYLIGGGIFSVLAGVLSFGAALQNHRLFGSAKTFVERAAYIERQAYFDVTKKSDDNEISQYAFMKDVLYASRWELSNNLTVLYTITGFVWIIFTTITATPYFQ